MVIAENGYLYQSGFSAYSCLCQYGCPLSTFQCVNNCMDVVHFYTYSQFQLMFTTEFFDFLSCRNPRSGSIRGVSESRFSVMEDKPARG